MKVSLFSVGISAIFIGPGVHFQTCTEASEVETNELQVPVENESHEDVEILQDKEPKVNIMDLPLDKQVEYMTKLLKEIDVPLLTDTKYEESILDMLAMNTRSMIGFLEAHPPSPPGDAQNALLGLVRNFMRSAATFGLQQKLMVIVATSQLRDMLYVLLCNSGSTDFCESQTPIVEQDFNEHDDGNGENFEDMEE